MASILKILLSFIVYYFLSISSKIGLKIYFTKIEASRIGHLLTNIDQAIYDLNKKKNFSILLIFLNGKISNNFIVTLWNKNKKIFFLSFVEKIILSSNHNYKLKKFFLGWDIIQPSFTKLYSSKANISVDKNKINLTNEENKLLNKEFVCLHNRDNEYTKNISKDDNYLEYKNFFFEDFNSTIEQIKKNKQIPIRIGNYIEDQYEKENLNYLDLSGNRSKEYMDILLQYYAKFTIIGLTGLSSVSNTFRKPLLYINYTPLLLNQLSWISQNSMILPKLIFSEREGRLLKFVEILKINFNIHQKENFFKKKNLKIINNTENEILESYNEMNKFIDNGFHNKENYELNKEFFKIFSEKEKANFILNTNLIRVPTFFLKKYLSLL